MDDTQIFLAKVQSHQLQAAYERCYAGPREHDLIPGNPLPVPAVICAALSAEIGLKALLFAAGKDPGREHNLKILLNLLPAGVQSEIRTQVSSEFPDFNAHLEKVEKAFIDWRYFYERKEEMSIAIPFIGALAGAIQSQINLEWERI